MGIRGKKRVGSRTLYETAQTCDRTPQGQICENAHGWLVGYWKEGAKDKRTGAEVTGRMVLAGLSHCVLSPTIMPHYMGIGHVLHLVSFGISPSF